MLSIGLSWFRALMATSDTMVVQLGFAMMPLCFLASWGLISGMTRGTSVVHEYRPRLYDGRCQPLGNVVFRRTQDNVHALEGFIAGQLHRELPALPIDLLPHGPL